MTSLRTVLVLSVIAACFSKPPFPGERDDGGTIVVADGPRDAPPAVCALYTFLTPPTDKCGGWATLDAGDAQIANDQLTLIAPTGTTTGAGRCLSPSLATTRATLDIVSAAVPRVANAHLSFFLAIAGTRYGATIANLDATETIQMMCGSTVAAAKRWFPSTQRYVRLAMTAPDHVELQLSSNGSDWDNIVGSCSVPVAPAQVGVEVERVGSGTTLSAAFEALEICR